MGIRKNQILKNSVLNVLQAIVNIFVLFFLYRYLLGTLGDKLLGVWSLTAAITSMFGIAQLGFGRSLMKYVAKYRALNDQKAISELVQTVFISIFVLIGLVSLVAYPLLLHSLDYVVEGPELAVAREILWMVILIFFIKNTFGAYPALLDGLQRMEIRGVIFIFSTVMFFLFTIILVPDHGVMGVLYAQLIQNILIPLFSIIFLKYRYSTIAIFPRIWRKKLFLETYGYGIKFQFISICQMLADPLTKAFLSKFGGISSVTYYEMANKMLANLRLVVVFAVDSIIPVVAELFETAPEKIGNVYRKTYDLVFIISLSGFLMIALSAPFISYLWIGKINGFFVISTYILSCSIMVSSLSMPAYQVNMGTGKLKANVMSNVALSLGNIVFGGGLGYLFGAVGVVIGLSIAIFLSAVVIFYYYYEDQKINIQDLISPENRLFFGATIGIFTVLFLTNQLFYQSSYLILINLISMVIYSGVVLWSLWRNPYRVYLMKKIFKR